MHILISNDDGFQAPGISALRHALRDLAELTVVAPNRNRSGASNSLTLERPIRAEQVNPGLYSVDGTPTDCVHLAITGLLEQEPDMVVSGINMGANLGDDVIYSGTVAGAIEGRFLGLPAVAISLTSHTPVYFDTAEYYAHKLIRQLIEHPIEQDIILNVNIPDLPLNEIKGIKTTRLGNRHKAEPAIKHYDPRGKPIFWVGAAGPEADAGEGTDFHAIKTGYVSITPIHVDLTRHNMLDTIAAWVHQNDWQAT